jgi:EF hand
MTNKLAQISIAALLLLGVSYGVASAQQAPAVTQNDQVAYNDVGPDGTQDGNFDMRRGRHHGHRGGGHQGQMGRMIDGNGDGVISDSEAAFLADGAFMHMDQDQNGSLSETEFSAGPRGHRGWFNWGSAESAAVVKVRQEKFARLDTDKNGGISKAEFFADAKMQLATADADKDGKVTAWEFLAAN